MAHDVVVIGSGVSGLTTAACLAEAGLAVRVDTAHMAPATPSAPAGAMRDPYLSSCWTGCGSGAAAAHGRRGSDDMALLAVARFRSVAPAPSVL
jgi:glycine/D-amino acid oxidase-like deaminating enzyme